MFPLQSIFLYGKIAVVQRESQFERQALASLRAQTPLRDLPRVRIRALKAQPEDAFDVQFELQSGKRRIVVLGEFKSAVPLKLLADIAPWIRRMKSLRPGVSFALICPALSPRAQTYCIEQGIDFIDLAGNISINVPGEFTLQRVGMRTSDRTGESTSPAFPNVFSGRYSRILRVLLEKPRAWTLTEISKELAAETDRIAKAFSTQTLQFAISLGAVSKTLSSLDEQLWVRRQGSSIIVPEPRRLLVEWAEKYKDRYRWRLRSSFETPNPLGSTLAEINSGLQSVVRGPYAFTAAAAASDAPFVDLDRIDIYVLPTKNDQKLRQLDGRPVSGMAPGLRFLYPYDEGVFLYASTDTSVPRVSNIQTYLDLYARGGRDLKQADYLLENVIAARWKTA
jgi:hypothetical protein